jgi:uncharacterized protein DUF6263
MKHIVLATLVALSLSTVATAAPDAPAGSPVVKLVDAGKGAKKQLRFTAKKGLTRSMVMTMKMGMAMSMGANSMPRQDLPVMKLTMDMKVTDVTAGGDIRYTFSLKQPEVIADKGTPQAVIDAVKSASKGMAGLTGYAVVTSRGFTKEADINVPKDADPQMKQFMDSIKQSLYQISAPLPEEAVGVGAKWDTVMQLTQNGMTLDQTATNELVDLKGDTGKLKLTLKQSAKPQKIAVNGMDVNVLSLASNGTGETSLDFTRLVPSQATVTLHSDLKMEAGGQKIGMQMDLTMGLTSK